MFYLVYKVTNLTNNKIYIGCHQTININDGYMGSGKLIKRAIKKYGLINFKKEILKMFNNVTDMFEYEKQLVNENYLNDGLVYNLTLGGNGGWSYINTTTDKTLRIEFARKGGKSNTKEHLLNINKSIPIKTKMKIGEYMGSNFGGSNRLTEKEINERLEIMKSVDLSKSGWVMILSKKLNISHTQVKKFVEKYYNGEFYRRNMPQ